MPHRLLLRLMAVAVLLPSTLGAGFGSLLGGAFVADALRRGHALPASAALAVAMAAGWFGLVTLWRLYYRLLRGDAGFSRRTAWLGLACGSAVSAGSMAVTGGTLPVRIVLFGWPLLGAAFFGAVLWRLPRTLKAPG